MEPSVSADCESRLPRGGSELSPRAARVGFSIEPRRSRPYQLQAWLYRQQSVWLDDKGDPHDVVSMSDDEVAEAIELCRRHALPIKILVALDLYAESLEERLVHARGSVAQMLALQAASVGVSDPASFVELTPLMKALRQQQVRRDRAA